MGLITSGDMPLTCRAFGYIVGDTAMTVWLTMYQVHMCRREEGLVLAYAQIVTEMEEIPADLLAPSMLDPIWMGYTIADSSLHRNAAFDDGVPRDFDAIVNAVARTTVAAAKTARDTAPLEEFMKTMVNSMGTDKGPQRE